MRMEIDKKLSENLIRHSERSEESCLTSTYGLPCTFYGKILRCAQDDNGLLGYIQSSSIRSGRVY